MEPKHIAQPLKKHSRLNSPVHLVKPRERHFARVHVYVHDYIADFVIGLQILRTDVDAVLGEDAVDLAEHAGHVLVNVQQAVFARVCRERHFGEVYRGEAGAVVAVTDEFFAYLDANVALGFHGAAAYVGCEDAVIELS